MSARYWVLVADELAYEDPDWASAGLEPVNAVVTSDQPDYPGACWWQFNDENAPDDLDGHKVELWLERTGDGWARVTKRIDLGPARDLDG